MLHELRIISSHTNGRSFLERFEVVTVDTRLLHAIHPIERGHVSTQFPLTAQSAVVLRETHAEHHTVLFLQTNLNRMFDDADERRLPLGINGRFIFTHIRFVDMTPLSPNMLICDRPFVVGGAGTSVRGLARD
ncbi:MAG: hypothetical protein JO126_06460 [Alphaproteobacteria bacterium]|nr:hypothetical protein [Alphaproteobacteria bacterium]MBV8549081.1 hypothetical protein [Alphaproteobacteria bacterium]